MQTVNTLWTLVWTVALAVGFAGIGVLGLGLMIGVVWYPTGLLWGVVVFLLGLLGVLLAVGAAMTAIHRPRTRPS